MCFNKNPEKDPIENTAFYFVRSSLFLIDESKDIDTEAIVISILGCFSNAKNFENPTSDS